MTDLSVLPVGWITVSTQARSQIYHQTHKISNIEAQQMECKYLISIQGILPDSKSDSSIIA